MLILEKNRRIIISASLVLLILLLNVPYFPNYTYDGIDGSWLWVLHSAWIKPLLFGKDIAWHYGPLGFLYFKVYHPETYPALLLGWVVLSLLFIYGIVRIGASQPENSLRLFFLTFIILLTDDAFFLAFPVFLLLHYYFISRDIRSVFLWLMLMACAVISCVKLDYFLAGLVSIICIEASRIFARKIPGIMLGFFFAGILLVWRLSSQEFQYIPAYLIANIELGKGFTAIANYFRPWWQMIGYIMVFTALIYMLGRAAIIRNKKSGIFCAAAFTGLLFIGLKMGFVQANDHHFLQAICLLLLVAILSKEFFWEGAGKFLRVIFAVLFTGYLGLIALYQPFDKGKSEIADFFETAKQAAGNNNLSGFSFNIFTLNEKIYFQKIADIKDKYRLPFKNGTTDLYDYDQGALLATAMDYHPRPVFQGYHAYTPYLAALNRDYLEGDSAPENIFFSIENFYDRFCTLDDGYSWPALLTHYDVKSLDGDYLYLKHRPVPAPYSLEKIATVDSAFDRNIDLPQLKEGALWAVVEIKSTWLGKVLRMLVKDPPVYIEYETVSGLKRRDRIIPDMAKIGFVLSPLITDTLHYAMLASDSGAILWQRNGMKNLRFIISPDSGNWKKWLFEDSIKINLYQLKFSVQKTDSIKNFRSKMLYALLSTGTAGKIMDLPSELALQPIGYKREYGKDSLITRANILMSYPLLGDEVRISGKYNIKKPAGGAASYPPDSIINFAIYGRIGGRRDLIWSDSLPLNRASAYEQKAFFAKFPAHIYKELVIETSLHGAGAEKNLVSWSEMKVN